MGRKGRKCAICKQTRSNFCASFPLDEKRCKEWLRVAGDKDLVHIPIEKLNQLRFVCATHFVNKDFNRKRNRLKKFAVPKINLGAPLNEEELSEFPLHMWKSDTHGIKPSQNKVVEHGGGESQPQDCVDPLCDEPEPEQEEPKPDIDELNVHLDHLSSENMSKVSSVEDLEKCCHLCLSQDCTLTPLVGSGLEEMLMDLFSLEVREGSLPALACGGCAARVSSAHGLQRLVRASHNHIMQLLQDKCIEGTQGAELQEELPKPVTTGEHDVLMQVDDVPHSLHESDKLSDDEYSLPEIPFEFDKSRKKIVCNICNETFKSSVLLTKHKVNEHGAEEAYVCRFCGKVIKNRTFIFKHERRHMKTNGVLPMDYKCEMCGAEFLVKAFWKRHITRMHNGQRLPACRHCARTFDTSDSYHDHLKEEHGDKTPFRCSLCPKAFEEKDMFDSHMMRHYKHKVKKRTAPVESTDTETSLAVAQIVVPVSQDIYPDSQNDDSAAAVRKPYPCAKCKKSFVSSYAFNRHKLRCRTMECEVCESEFEELKSLLHHYKSVHGITAVENTGVTRETPASHAAAVRRDAGNNTLIQIRPATQPPSDTGIQTQSEQAPKHLVRVILL